MARLERFRKAQEQPYAGYVAALGELRAGEKHGHWIWYVFPQLSGLGKSHFSRVYGIADVAEATEYLRDPVLRHRLLTASVTVTEGLRAGLSLSTLMNSPLDVRKLVSSMTLFGSIGRTLQATEANDEYRLLADVAAEILAAAESEGDPPCRYTLSYLATQL